MSNKVIVNGIDVFEDIEYKENLIKDLKDVVSKQNKLLELYKEINNKRKELITLSRHNTWSWKLDIEINEIQDKIKELEKEKENERKSNNYLETVIEVISNTMVDMSELFNELEEEKENE